jgi:hypothetical protein
MAQHGAAGDGVRGLGQSGLHAGAESGGKDDGGGGQEKNPKRGSMFFFEKKNQKTLAPLETGV